MSEPTPSSPVLVQSKRQQGAPPSKSESATRRTATQQQNSNLADSSDARTAQFTLISILLGVILAALLIGLPRGANTFAINLFSYEPGVNLRALAVVLMAAVLWLEYTWGILTRFVFATPAHNLTYFALAIAATGVALAVADFRAWLAWIAGLAGVAVISGIINHRKPRTEVLKEYYQKNLQLLDAIEFIAFFVVFVASLVASLMEYLWTPPFLTAQAQVAYSAAVLAIVVWDLVMQFTVYIPRLRRLPVSTDD
jgi:hypothetical protein